MLRKNVIFAFCCGILLLLSSATYSQISFTDVSASAGVNNSQWGHGVAFGDYDNDGLEDIYISNGVGGDILYHNQGDGTFLDVAYQAGIYNPQNGSAVAFGDYDNDGNLDLYVTIAQGYNKLYRNEGHGLFEDVSSKAGVASPLVPIGMAWNDFDNDGFLDIYVSNYDGPDHLYKNNTDGTFTDVASTAGIGNYDKCEGVATGDYNNDGYVDILVCRDSEPNVLYKNNGDGTFANVAELAGVAASGPARGVAFGDIDNDGLLDIYIVNGQVGGSPVRDILYRNNGDGTFQDISSIAGVTSLADGSGVAFGDLNNDGHVDIYVCNNDDYNNLLYLNNGDGTFTEKGVEAGVANKVGAGRAVAIADCDNDGYLDIYVVNGTNVSPHNVNILYRNNGNDNNWLIIKAIGRASNRAGIGARVKVIAGNLSQIGEVTGGSGQSSQNSLPLEFGLADYSQADSVIVRWPSGLIDTLYAIGVNQIITILEGETKPLSSVTGRVSDANTGYVIPGAAVKYTGPFSGTALSDQDGNYQIVSLLAGRYTLQASADGYKESDPVTVTVPPDAIVNFSLKSPDIDVSPDSFQVELESGQKITQTLTVSNSGSDTLIFQVSQTPWQSGAQRQEAPNVSKQIPKTSELPDSHYPGKFLKATGTLQMPSSGPILNAPIASVIPILDGKYKQGEWEDAITASATSIHYPQGQEVGKVYVKNSIENLYVLIDYHSGSVYAKSITGDIWLDLDNNGTIDGGFYTDLSSGVPVTYFDFPAEVAVGPSSSPDNPSPHWIFEYEIPLSGLGVALGDTVDVHFVLYNFSWWDGGEWYNASSEFDFSHPDRWGKLSLAFQAPWLSIEPMSGILPPGESLPVDINFDATGLSNGVYRAVIKIQSNDPDEGEILIPAQLTVDPSAYVEEKTLGLPDVFSISQNYPNPFNIETRIRYQLPEPSRVSIKIYDLLGRGVRTLVETQKNPGYYEVVWRGGDDWGREVGSGVYICRLRAGDFVGSRKVVIMK